MIPLPEPWLESARDLADEFVSDGRVGERGWSEFWTVERRRAASDRLGRTATETEHAALARAVRALVVLESLPTVDAPLELDGRIVAALHAGHRQARATAYVESLSRLPVPRELDERVRLRISRDAGPIGIESDSTGDSESRLLELASQLEPAFAPEELEDRVESKLRANRTVEDGPEDASRTARFRVLAGTALLAAAAVAVTFVGAQLASTPNDTAPEDLDRVADVEAYPEFVIETVDPRELGSRDRWIVGALGAPVAGGQG